MDGPARHQGGDGGGEHLLFAFLATEANDVVKPIHGKARPVMLTAETAEQWLTADISAALALQQPFPAKRMKVVASGKREDVSAIGSLLL